MADYTVQDYVIYIAILLVVLWVFQRFVFRRIDFDRNFLMATIPYIIFGITLRMLVDVGIYEKSQYWNVTPGVHIVSVSLGMAGVLTGLFLRRYFEIEYWVPVMAVGSLAALFVLSKLVPEIDHPVRILPPVFMAGGITAIIYLLSGFHPKLGIFRWPSNMAIIFAHLFDGSATYIGIDYYGFYEEHLLPDILINAAGTAFVMIPLKIMVVLLAIYYVERWYREEAQGEDVKKMTTQYHVLKLVFFILGFGPGMRDSILPAVL
jgi:uncharacterized membrane protein